MTVCVAPPRPAASACGPAREPAQAATAAAGAARSSRRAGMPCQDPFTDAGPVREHVRSLMAGQAAERLQVSRDALEQAHRRYRSRMLPLLEAFGRLQAEAPDLAPEEAAERAGSTLAALDEARERLCVRPGQLAAA